MEATGATPPPPEVSPELLKPLVAVVAILGELGTTPGDIPLSRPPSSLRARLVAVIATIIRALEHGHSEATRLCRALATAAATPEPATVPPGDSAGPRATVGDAWATVATAARRWRAAVASVEENWATVAREVKLLRDTCGTAATAGTTAKVTLSHLAAAVAREDEAKWELLEVTRRLPVAVEWDKVAEAVTSHGTQVAKTRGQLQEATEATERMAVAVVGTMDAEARRQWAVMAHEAMGRLVAACEGATKLYCHLRCRLESVEAAVAAVAAGHGGPEAPGVAQEHPGVPRATMPVQGGPGVPQDLVAEAKVLWDASSRLAKDHLLRTLRVARGLLATPGVPDATMVATVVQRCQDATAAIPGLLRQQL